MGRPMKKSYMAGNASGQAGQIAVTAFRPSGGAKVDSTTAYIINQRGSKKFKISLADSTTGIYELKAVAPGSLGNSSNQFCVQAILNDSTVVYVEKFYNRTIHWVDGAGNTGRAFFTLGTEGTDEGGGAGASSEGIQSASIDVITDQ
tara:strand:- start:5 stop:445 length:441 start_codon:yes stop_codon:yes gene_type:complete